MKRMIEFADKNNLEIVLAYYPPYHSKYNPVERCWGILENHWGATLLNTLEVTLEWAKTMTWKGLRPVVKLLETTYQRVQPQFKAAATEGTPKRFIFCQNCVHL
jgi:hypothetical protein